MTILFLALSCLFAADEGHVQWKYKINKFVAESLSSYFTTTTGSAITTLAVDMEKTLSQPQAQLVIVTNKTTENSLDITFGPMKYKVGSEGYDASFFGCYDVRISDLFQSTETDPDHVDIPITSAEGATETIPLDYTDDASHVITCYYPIAFYFSEKNLDNYGPGSFEATITVEIGGS